MWNISACALLAGATVVVYDGAPTYPSVDALFDLAARTGITFFGTSPGYLGACEKAGERPGERHDLSAVRMIGVTGSPLPSSTFRWVYDAVKGDVFLGSLSGGTDVATGFIGSAPLLPVTVGELQRPMLAVAAASWNEDGEPVIGELGELVITEPMPSMPLYFWNDPDGTRFREAYFEPWPGVWRHGDWLEITPRGTCIITGRSDSTLNRGGVRMGTADIYAAVESIPAVVDCVVLGVELPDGGYWMPLFVQLAPGIGAHRRAAGRAEGGDPVAGLAAARARRDHRRPRRAAHPHRQAAGGAAQAAVPGRRPGEGGQPRRGGRRVRRRPLHRPGQGPRRPQLVH